MGHRWQNNRTHARTMTDNEGYRHTLRICNIYAFPLQQWSHEGASVLRYTYTASLVIPHMYQMLRPS